MNAKNTALGQRSVKTQYVGVWHALFKLSCVNGEKSENSCMIQQETRLRKRREERRRHNYVSDIAELLSLDTDGEDVSIKNTSKDCAGNKNNIYFYEFCASNYFEGRKNVI